jgi:hypothetical protein
LINIPPKKFPCTDKSSEEHAGFVTLFKMLIILVTIFMMTSDVLSIHALFHFISTILWNSYDQLLPLSRLQTKTLRFSQVALLITGHTVSKCQRQYSNSYLQSLGSKHLCHSDSDVFSSRSLEQSDKLSSASQICPYAYFHTAHELKKNFFWLVLGFELRNLCWLGRCSTA